ncbi:pyroglutamylated RF-amide peptide receptor-like [Oculina patagonica]
MCDPACVAITTVLSILVVVDIVGNSLVCVIIKRHQDMRIPINYLLLNLAVADILFAIFITPKVILRLTSSHPEGVTGTVLCKFLTAGNVAWVGAASSIVTLVAIAIERYYAVMYPVGNKGNFTKRKAKIIIFGSWIFSFILQIPKFLIKSFEKKSNSCVDTWPEQWMVMAYNVTWDIIIALPLLLMVVLYSRVVYSLWLKRDDSYQLNVQQEGVMRIRKRVTLMVVIVSVIFGICWGADLVVYTLIFSASYNIGSVPVAIINTMVLFNSAVNPFVYGLFNQQFRNKFKVMVSGTGSPERSITHPWQEVEDIELV